MPAIGCSDAPSIDDSHRDSRYRRYIASRFRSESPAIAAAWLKRLELVVHEAARDVFPTGDYLDHIPLMIEQLGVILEGGDGELVMDNSVICAKSLELGRLRYEQKATISQLLREYDVLARLLSSYQRRWTREFTYEIDVDEVLAVSEIKNLVIRMVLQYTVEAFAELYMATIHDQTDKLLSFNRFLGHELRSSLNSALLGVDLIIESSDTSDVQGQELQAVRGSLNDTAAVIDHVERLVSIEKSRLSDGFSTQKIALKPLVLDIARQLSDAMTARGVELHVSDDLGEARMETGSIKLLLNNLLSNAIKYCDPEKPQRMIWVTRTDSSDGVMELVVRDNGLGIPDDRLQEVFRMHVRAHADLDEIHSISGDGLGLYLVDEAMRELGGSVVLESSVGEETSVRLIFPAND